ncbi:MAG: alpha/beta hydrolase, partial [Thermodesulfobacteriota bacterium]
MKYCLSVFNKFAIEYLVLIMCAMFLAFAILSCDSTSSDDGGGDPSPTASPAPTPTPAPGGSIIEPGGTLSMVPETFDYVGNGNERQMLDYYEITGLPSQETAAEVSTSGVLAARPVIVSLHGGAWVLGDRGDVDPLVFDAAVMGGFHLISVGYRLATEAAWPAQIHDANAAVRWIKQNAGELNINPDKLIIIGGSAGAQIGGAVAMASDIESLQGPHNNEPPTSTDV